MSDAEIVRNALGVAWSMPDAVLQHTDPRFKWWDGPLREAIDAAKPALDRLQSQNQALQEALKEAAMTVHLKHPHASLTIGPFNSCEHALCTRYRNALSPTQETDKEVE